MHQEPTNRRRLTLLIRAMIEIVFIVFLYYSNLLMGEFTQTNGRGKSITFALNDIVTGTNFLIAIISALIGWVVLEYFRRKL
jgi:ABC-type arginine transport system permease subunit